MTSAVETAPSHHRAWYESVSVPSSSRGGNDESASESMAMVEHVNSFYNAVLDSTPRDYRSSGPYSRDVLMSSRYHYQHSP